MKGESQEDKGIQGTVECKKAGGMNNFPDPLNLHIHSHNHMTGHYGILTWFYSVCLGKGRDMTHPSQAATVSTVDNSKLNCICS